MHWIVDSKKLQRNAIFVIFAENMLITLFDAGNILNHKIKKWQNTLETWLNHYNVQHSTLMKILAEGKISGRVSDFFMCEKFWAGYNWTSFLSVLWWPPDQSQVAHVKSMSRTTSEPTLTLTSSGSRKIKTLISIPKFITFIYNAWDA